MKVNSDSGSRGLRASYFYPNRRVTGAFTRKHAIREATDYLASNTTAARSFAAIGFSMIHYIALCTAAISAKYIFR